MSDIMESIEPLPSVVVDANVLIAAVRPDIGHVRPEDADASVALLDAIDRGRCHAFIPSALVAEVIHVLARNGVGASARRALVARWSAMPGRLDIVPVDLSLAFEAGEYRQANYHRDRLPLSYADCFCVALARQRGVPIVTIEEPLQRAPGVISLPPAQFLLRL